MVSHDSGARRSLATCIACKEARRRALDVGKVAAIVIITILATLVFTGHRVTPNCVQAIVCFDSGWE